MNGSNNDDSGGDNEEEEEDEDPDEVKDERSKITSMEETRIEVIATIHRQCTNGTSTRAS